MNDIGDEEPHLEIEPVIKIPNGPTYEEMMKDKVLKNSEPLRNRCQGTLFTLTVDEAKYLLGLISENQTEIDKYTTSGEELDI